MSELDCEITFCVCVLSGEGRKIKALPNERPDSSVSSLLFLPFPPPPPFVLTFGTFSVLRIAPPPFFTFSM